MINLHSNLELDKLSITELIEILYSLDWNGSWRDLEEGQDPLTKKEAINYIFSYVNYDPNVKWYADSKFKVFRQNIPIDVNRLFYSIKIEVEKSIEYLFYEIHEKLNTKSGDITPEQSERLEELKFKLTELITEQTTQNL